MVVERDGVVLADFNDCKIKGTAVRPMLKAFGAPTVLFKSHSFAQAYPNCYDFADPADAQLMTREDFLETFLDALRELRPSYAVPFASMVAFLHPESRQCNVYAVRPPEVAAVAAAADVGATTRTVLMVPGDTWSSESGFALEPNDYYENQDQWIERLAQSADPKIRQEEADERTMTLTFQTFERHFGGFLRSLPPLIWLVLKRPMVFEVPSDPQRSWVLDSGPARFDVARNHRSGIRRHRPPQRGDPRRRDREERGGVRAHLDAPPYRARARRRADRFSLLGITVAPRARLLPAPQDGDAPGHRGAVAAPCRGVGLRAIAPQPAILRSEGDGHAHEPPI